MDKSIISPILAHGGDVGFYYKNLVTGDTLAHNERQPLLAASVIKLTVMAEAFRRMDEGSISPDEPFVISEADKLPSCGALNYMHTGLRVTFLDLVTLMIILSDNTATNLLIKRLGMDNINAFIKKLGLESTRLERLLFDSEAAARSLENRISALDMGKLLEMIYRGELVSPSASKKMLDILLDQRLNGKLPLPLPRDIDVAHKTGEDSSLTHDVGIVYAHEPYVICICSNGVYAPDFERSLHEVSLAVFNLNR